MYSPNHFKQFTGYVQKGTPLWLIKAFREKQHQDLSFKSPPEMDPNRVIDEYYSVGCIKPSLNGFPWSPPINDPQISFYYFV